MKFKNISICLLSIYLLSFQVIAKETFSFGANNDVQILSDKAFRKSSENSYEAHGNVIIKLKNDSIYGEKASLSFETGQGRVWGNVRYVGAEFTLYGTEISYQLKNENLTIENAKLVDENFVILGKKIQRFENGNFEAIDAEYSTCKDCPESWSIQGSEVRVIPNEYIYMKHAFVKIKGVIVVYIPYIVLPIKKDRESGLLFPKLGFDLEKGFYFQQPYFWAINKSSDLTLSPTSYGQRAVGTEWEYRKAINNDSDFSLFNMQSLDRIWKPGKLNEDLNSQRDLRQFYDFQYFYKPNNMRSLYSRGKYLSDLDILSDYNTYLESRLLDNEHGYMAGVQEVFPNFYIAAEGNFQNNSFHSNPKGFDHSYVQSLGQIELAHTPVNFIQSSGPISKISLWQSLKFDYFKQNHVEESENIRNIQRADYTPTVDIHFRPFGPLNLKTQLQLDYQHYNIPHEVVGTQSARKYGKSIKSSLWFEVEKIFGHPYIEQVKTPPVIEETSSSHLISDVPNIKKETKTQEVIHSSYKHLLKYGINHSFYEAQEISGNKKLQDQFLKDSTEGRFDTRDTVKGRDQNIFDVATRTDLPESNTLEFAIGNSLLKKSPRANMKPFENFKYQMDNFDYSKIAYFDISQGLLLDTDDGTRELEFKERLTRLYTNFGLSFGNFSISGSEYYFHQTDEHITSLGIDHNLKYFLYSIDYVYDSFSAQRRYTTLDFKFFFSDFFEMRMGHYFDFEKDRVYESYLGGLYIPKNNCWKLDVEYRQKDQIRNGSLTKDQIFGFNFLLNYNSKGFNSVLGLKL